MLGLTKDLLEKILVACPDTLAGKRDAALLSVGYDTLCRSSELCWMRLEHLSLDEGRIYIPRSKSDPFGDGRFANLLSTTVEYVCHWLNGSQISCGPLFRGLHTGAVATNQMETSSIRRLLKSAAQRAGLETEAWSLSGDSMRIGAAQDMLEAGFDTLSILTAGGWKNVEVVSRYVENAKVHVKWPTRSPTA